jgi:uncharacterized membrane protein YhaH (DUF805 family)
METASSELSNLLLRHRDRFPPVAAVAAVDDTPMFGAQPLEASRKGRKLRHLFMPLTAVALAAAWCLQYSHYLTLEWYTPRFSGEPPGLWAGVHVLLVFGLCCIPTHVVWVKRLHRRPGALALVASILCLVWCAGEFFLGAYLF